MPANALTPTEELALDLLAARFRLGEAIWTFRRRQAPALARLEGRGLIFTMHGITEGTIRAGLTVAGKEIALSPTYIAPAMAEASVAV